MDGDGCDDCTNGLPDVANDGLDTDGDGLCDSGDDDDDDDGVLDGDDDDPLDPSVCGDADEDGCDDCDPTCEPTTQEEPTQEEPTDNISRDPKSEGCGCDSTGRQSVAWTLLVLAVLFRRKQHLRQRVTSRPTLARG